jgi:hypothetical protein
MPEPGTPDSHLQDIGLECASDTSTALIGPDTPEKAILTSRIESSRPGLIWVVLVLIGWGGMLLAGTLPYQRQFIAWRGPDAQILHGDIWLPVRPGLPAGPTPPALSGKDRLLPGVILVHGVMASREQPELAARSLAASGMAVMSFDLRGYGESDRAPDTAEVHRADVLAALAFLRAQPGIDPQRIALLGHSMGATAVSEAAAEDGHLKLALAMGMHGEGPVEWLTGLYDALHPPGAFGQAKPVTISPAANHHVEWQDLWLLSHIQHRLETDLGLPAGQLPWREWVRFWSGWL